MALVLRKAVLPKNVSLLKCIKGRSLATAASKKNPAPLSQVNTKKWSLEPLAGLFRGIQSVRMKDMFGWLTEEPAARAMPYKSASCPNLTRATDVRPPAPRHFLRKARSEVFPSVCKPAITTTLRAAAWACPPPPPTNLVNESVKADALQRSAVLEKLALSCGPCCGPCGPCGPCGCGGGCASGCGCLPPPCNTPPRCLQAMTGYYYYPYGVWFCGPYHVTNTCCPGGPVTPGGPCGPNPPAPGGPCGPCAPGCCCGLVDPTAILNTASNGPAASKGAASSNSPVSSNNPACTANGPAKSMSTMCPPVSLACGPCCCRPYKGCKSCGPCGPCGPCCGRSCYPCGPCGAYYCCRGCGCCGCGPCCGGCCGPCGPCGCCGPCGPYRCGPYACCGGCGPCGSGPCGCGPCGCGPCGCGPCGCGPCGCAPCGCGPCGCGPCGCGPCGCGLCGCGPCGCGCPPCRCGCGAFGCCCGVGPVGGVNDSNLNTAPFPTPTLPSSVSFPFMGSEQQHAAPPMFTHDPLKSSRPPAPMPAAPLCRSAPANDGDNPHASKNMTSQLTPNVTCYCALCRAARVLSHSAEDEEFRFPPDDITPKPVPLSTPKSEETAPFNRKFHFKKKRVC